MKEDQEPSGGALVSSSNRALTRNSGLVRRGLDDLLNRQSPVDSSDVSLNPKKELAGTIPEQTPSSSSDLWEQVRRLAEQLQLPETGVENTLGMAFIKIPSGKFMMGSDAKEDEKPIHEVTIRYSFLMGRHLVTQSQWQEIMGDNPSEFLGDDYPVHGVSWDDAHDFIRKLNLLDLEEKIHYYDELTGEETRPRVLFTYRLSSEAEWEYACRADTTGDYAGPLDSMAWYANNSGQHYVDAERILKTDGSNYGKRVITDNGNHPHAVGTKEANAFGLYDMHGNVWEWCQDIYDKNYYRISPSIDPQGPSSGPHRVLRGGSWDTHAADLRSAYRDAGTPDLRNAADGFRLVAVVRTQ